MINDRNTTEIIGLYLQGELDGEMLHAFNERLATDEDFKHEVEVQRLMVRNIKRTGRNELRQYLKDIHKELTRVDDIPLGSKEFPINNNTRHKGSALPIRRPMSGKFIFRVAASVTAIAIAAFVLYAINFSPEQIYTPEFQPYKIGVIRGNEDGDLNYSKAFYEKQDYINYLKHYESDRDKSVLETFLAGNAYMMLNQFPKAITCFNEVMTLNESLPVEDTRFYEDAEFYLALSYLKTGQLQQAEAIFKKIHNNANHSYHNRIGNYFLFKIWLLKL